jgi:fumarate reductase subunit C
MSDLEQFRVQVVYLPSVGCMTKGSAEKYKKYINFVHNTVVVGCGLYSLVDIHS